MDHVSLSDGTAVEAVDAVHLTQLLAGDRLSLQRFEIEPGAVVPEHSHHHEQAGVVLEGELTFTVDGEDHVVGPGEAFRFAGDEPHAAANRGETTVRGVDVFAPPRSAPDWAE